MVTADLPVGSRTTLTAPLGLFVNQQYGNDSTGDGLTQTTAWRNLQKACDYISNRLDLAGYRVTVYIGSNPATAADKNGTAYTSGCNLEGPPPGNCYLCVWFQPQTGVMGDAYINITNGDRAAFGFSTELSAKGWIVYLYRLKIKQSSSTGSQNCVEAEGGFMRLQQIEFTGCPQTAIYGRHMGQYQFINGPSGEPAITYSGTFGYLAGCQSGATCYWENSTVNFSAATTCTYVCWIADGAGVWAFNMTFQNAGTACAGTLGTNCANVTGQRFAVSKTTGFIYTALNVGQTAPTSLYFPGTIAGSIGRGGRTDMLDTPTLTGSCGTSPSLASGSTDLGGTLIWGTGNPTGPCTINFRVNYAFAPSTCVFIWRSVLPTMTYSYQGTNPAKWDLTQSASSGNAVDYICQPY
jgi:hypothetical protein